jgi:hypothetical protein
MKTYVLRDVTSLNKIQEFCQQAPNVTLGQLAEAQKQAQERLEKGLVNV